MVAVKVIDDDNGRSSKNVDVGGKKYVDGHKKQILMMIKFHPKMDQTLTAGTDTKYRR